MTSISGKNDIDWQTFSAKLAPVEVIDEPVLVKKTVPRLLLVQPDPERSVETQIW